MHRWFEVLVEAGEMVAEPFAGEVGVGGRLKDHGLRG